MSNSSNELLPLNEHLCFLFYATSRAIQRGYHQTLAEQGLTYPQYLVLVILYEHHQLTIKEIGTYLALDSGTVTPLIKRMTTAGLLRKQRDKDDERIVYVAITPQGQEKRIAMQTLPDVLLDHSQLSSTEWQQLSQLTNKLWHNLQQADSEHKN